MAKRLVLGVGFRVFFLTSYLLLNISWVASVLLIYTNCMLRAKLKKLCAKLCSNLYNNTIAYKVDTLCLTKPILQF